MRILIIGDPIKKLNPAADSSFFLARAAVNAGHEVHWCEAKDLSLSNEKVFVTSCPVKKALAKKALVLGKATKPKALSEFTSVWVRKDPPFDTSYVSLCWMLSLAELDVLIVNAPSLLLTHHEKLLPLQAIRAGFLEESDILPTLVHAGKSKPVFTRDFTRSEVVAKPWLGFGGRSVKRMKSTAAATRAALRSSAAEHTIYQPFLEHVTQVGDRRVIFIDGDYSGDFVRLPKKGSFVANLAQGGSAVLRQRSPSEIDLCNRIGSFLKSTGILFAGVDLIGSFVTEMNITSPTGLQTLVDLGGDDLGKKFLRMVELNRK